jgi:hypothetical protein
MKTRTIVGGMAVTIVLVIIVLIFIAGPKSDCVREKFSETALLSGRLVTNMYIAQTPEKGEFVVTEYEGGWKAYMCNSDQPFHTGIGAPLYGTTIDEWKMNDDGLMVAEGSTCTAYYNGPRVALIFESYMEKCAGF